MKTHIKKVPIHQANLWKSKMPLLTSLVVELTERCNNNCVHCYINKPANDQASLEKELSNSEVFRILEEAASLGCLNVRFTGGEPMLREDFESIYLHARKLGMIVEIFTNATLITPKLADLFVKIPPRKEIMVSLYGMSKGTYGSVTGVPDNHTAAFSGINLLLSRKIPFFVVTAYLPQNRHELEEMETWISAQPGIDKELSMAMFLDLHGRRDQKKSKEIEKNRIPPQEGLQSMLKNEKEYRKGAQEFFSNIHSPPDSRLFSCGAGVGSGCVDSSGKIQMCTRLRHPDTVYDLKNGTIKDALTNFFPRIRKLRSTAPQYLSRCSQCFLKGFCDMCPAKSWSVGGTLDAIDEYFCEAIHMEAKFLGLLKKNEKAWEVEDLEDRITKFMKNPNSQQNK